MKTIPIPTALLETPHPPEKLYIEGTLPDPEHHIYLAVVGSRRFSSYGKEACEKIIGGLSGYPIAIVSGLAVGIDSIAHKAAMNAGLPTVGVPGSGLDRSVLYPQSNKALADEIIKRGGALLSEFEPDTAATLYTFPQRNRIMAGLSRGVLVIEAGEKSGTLITARLALEYNRDVFAIPGSIFSPNSRGTNWLLRQGAMPISKPEELLESLGFETVQEKELDTAELSDDERMLIDLLVEPLTRDDIIRASGFPASEANSLLMTLEIKGFIKEIAGEFVKN